MTEHEIDHGSDRPRPSGSEDDDTSQGLPTETETSPARGGCIHVNLLQFSRGGPARCADCLRLVRRSRPRIDPTMDIVYVLEYAATPDVRQATLLPDPGPAERAGVGREDGDPGDEQDDAPEG